MNVRTVPVDDELAALGMCFQCKQPFEGDEFYCQVQQDESPIVWLVCVGCGALLAFG